MTDPRDRLIALSGVARLFWENWWTESKYLAGLWSHDFAQEVLWHRVWPEAVDLLPFDSDSRMETNKYCAPSWSWAATPGTVDQAWPPCVSPLWTLRDAVVVPEIERVEWAGARGGWIEVEAVIRKVGWDVKDLGNQGLLKENRRVGLVYTDVVMKEEVGEGWAVVVGENRGRLRNLYGLLVVRVERGGEGGEFRRIGMWNVHEKIKEDGWEDEPWDDVEGWMMEERRVIKII